jgi:hypothetical protein
VSVLVIWLFLFSGRGDIGQTHTAGQILFGGLLRSPDHPPAIASRRYSGANKKEKQQGGKQQQSAGKQQPGLVGLLFRLGDGNGAGALHWLVPDDPTMMRESGGFCKPPSPSGSS